MVENGEVDEWVDLDDNYMEEEDDDVEERLDVDDGGGDGNVVEEYRNLKTEVDDGKDQSSELERTHVDSEHVVEDEEKSMAFVSEEDKEKSMAFVSEEDKEKSMAFVSEEDKEKSMAFVSEEDKEKSMAFVSEEDKEKSMAFVSEEDKEKSMAFVSEEDKEKHAQLLALPPNGSEVFIGGLPKDASEADLAELCEPIGEIYEIRLVKDKESGESKGYAFVSFKSEEVAQKAIEDLHSKQLKGKTIRCSLTETKNRLFVGNIPKSWTEDEFRKSIEGVSPGVEHIELVKDPQNTSRNRGFAFITYYNYACADYSRLKMSSSNFMLDDSAPNVTWADPKSTSDHSAASQVKALYVKNIPDNTSTEKLKEVFQRHGEVTKVVMPPGKAGKRDFGFIHYAERSSALKAVKDTEKYEIDGQVLEVVLAKPLADKKTDAAYPYSAGLHPNHLPHAGYGGFTGASYGSVSAGFGPATSFQQPVIYGRGPMPTGMAMVPMVLPDGRIGYVLQDPGVQMPTSRPERVDRSNRPGGPTGRGGSEDRNRSRKYRPY